MQQQNPKSSPEVPADFPREEILGSVSGAQPKLLLQKRDDGSYGPICRSDEEIKMRFEAADDLVQHLCQYFSRKRSEHPEWTREQHLERIRRGLANKANEGKWPFSLAEQEWIMNRLHALCSE